MSDYRLIGTLSPSALQQLLENPKEKAIIQFCRVLILFAKQFSHLAFIILPNELKQVIYSRENIELRILFENVLRDVNSPIIFPQALENYCFDLYRDKEKTKVSSINSILATYIKINKFPILFDNESYYLRKEKCSTCDTEKCKREILFKTKTLEVKNQGKFSVFNLDDVKDWLINEKTFSLENLKKLAYLYAFLFDASKTDVIMFERVDFSSGFVNDIKKIETKDMFKLASSVFRGTVYPPFVENSNIKNSLDWHSYKGLKLKEGESMSRIDVMEPTQQTQSGKKRIYRFQKDGKIYILLYDTDHGEDITLKTLKKRLEKIREIST